MCVTEAAGLTMAFLGIGLASYADVAGAVRAHLPRSLRALRFVIREAIGFGPGIPTYDGSVEMRLEMRGRIRSKWSAGTTTEEKLGFLEDGYWKHEHRLLDLKEELKRHVVETKQQLERQAGKFESDLGRAIDSVRTGSRGLRVFGALLSILGTILLAFGC